MTGTSQHFAEHPLLNAVRLNIEVVTETYPPEVNGVAHTLSMLVRGLVKNDHRVSIVRPEQPSDPETPNNPFGHNYLVRSLPIPVYAELRMGMPAKRTLMKRWTLTRPDVIHVATEGPLGWSAVQAARALGLPVTSDFRTNFHAYSALYNIGFLKPVITAYMRWLHNATDRTMVPTDSLKQTLSGIGFKHLQVMPRGVDTQHFSPVCRSEQLRNNWRVNPTDVVLLSVGRLAVEKNLEVVLRSYAAAKRVEPSTKLVIVGDGPLRPRLMAKCPDAIFAGTKKGVELAEHYASADIFVFPSLTETFGNVTIEAMASGLAVVAYRHAAAGDLIKSGINGMAVEPDDENAFVDTVVRTVLNRSLARQLGQAALSTASDHSWETIVRNTEAVFREVIYARARHDNFMIPT